MATRSSSQKRKRTSASDNEEVGLAMTFKKEKRVTIKPSTDNPNATKSGITTRSLSSKLAAENPLPTYDSDCEEGTRSAGNSKVPAVVNGGTLSQATLSEVLLPVVWGHKRLAVRRYRDYNAVIEAVKKSNSMRQLRTQSFYFQGVLPQFGGRVGAEWEITEDVWPHVVSTLSSVSVVVSVAVDNDAPKAVEGTAGGLAVPSAPATQDSSGRDNIERQYIVVYVENLQKQRQSFRFKSSDTVGTLVRRLDQIQGSFDKEYRLTVDGRTPSYDERLIDCENDTFLLLPRQVGGKPVIYIQSPNILKDVEVSLALVPEWSFLAVYPTSTIDRDEEGERIRWKVDAAPDGTLLDKASGASVSYLFWEAKTHPAPPLTPSSSRPSTPQRSEHVQLQKFDPSRPVISPEVAVLLAIDKVPAYVDRALEALTLHTEARTSFITYWLPSLLKHEYVALQFLPQKAYEVAAPMNVSPAPEVVTRVFMVFRGVAENDLSQWTQAQLRAEESVSRWAGIVGVDVERASNPSLYRVLEWGGMEIQ